MEDKAASEAEDKAVKTSEGSSDKAEYNLLQTTAGAEEAEVVGQEKVRVKTMTLSCLMPTETRVTQFKPHRLKKQTRSAIDSDKRTVQALVPTHSPKLQEQVTLTVWMKMHQSVSAPMKVQMKKRRKKMHLSECTMPVSRFQHKAISVS